MDSEELDSVTFSIHASAKEATLQMNRFPRLSNFQSTPPRRRRPHGGKWHEFNQFFNPRLREGGDNPAKLEAFRDLVFSIHASAKEATQVRNKALRGNAFQSTPPRRRRLALQFLKIRQKDVFNPRLREGGDKAYKTAGMSANFSIHASAKEATATYCNTPAIMCISSLNNFFVHHF